MRPSWSRWSFLIIRHHVIDQDTLIFILAIIPAVILHEVSHGVVALWCGDDTAKRAGRLTLNPIKHIDPVGTIIVPVVLALTHGPVFAWAKPVPVSVNRLRHPRNQSVLVALAGPATNIILASIAGVILHELLVHAQTGLVAQIVFEFGVVNVFLAVFNLIPIPPLDGSALIERLLAGLGPADLLPAAHGLHRRRAAARLLRPEPALEHLQQLRDLVPEHLHLSRPARTRARAARSPGGPAARVSEADRARLPAPFSSRLGTFSGSAVISQ